MTNEKNTSASEDQAKKGMTQPEQPVRHDEDALSDEELGNAVGGQKPQKPFFVREGGPIIIG